MARTNVVRFPVPDALDVRLDRARKAAQTDETIEHALRWWFGRYKQQAWQWEEGSSQDEWIRDNPPPTTRDEAVKTDERFREGSAELWEKVHSAFVAAGQRIDDLMQRGASLAPPEPDLPNLDGLSNKEILKLQWGSLGQPGMTDRLREHYERAAARARDREEDTELEALPDDAEVTGPDAGRFLNTTAILNWIYSGKLTGTKRPRGPRGFVWVVPAQEVKRLRVEHAARIEEERAWAYNAAPAAAGR